MRALLYTILFSTVCSAQGPAVSAEEVEEANNPLADADALGFQNYYSPSVYGVPNVSTNTLNLRPVIVSGRQIIRFTIPVTTVPAGPGTIDIPGQGSLPSIALPIGPLQYRSGLGDVNVFDSIRLTPNAAATQLAVGPLLVGPSSTNSSLGSGKWQAGVAGVVIHPLAGGSMLGALITWQHDFAGDRDRPGVNTATFQPVITGSVGGGYYLKSSGAVWVFDFRNNRVLIPFGIGIGKVMKLGGATANFSFEPDFTVYHKGAGFPSIQLVAGMNLQWSKK